MNLGWNNLGKNADSKNAIFAPPWSMAWTNICITSISFKVIFGINNCNQYKVFLGQYAKRMEIGFWGKLENSWEVVTWAKSQKPEQRIQKKYECTTCLNLKMEIKYFPQVVNILFEVHAHNSCVAVIIEQWDVYTNNLAQFIGPQLLLLSFRVRTSSRRTGLGVLAKNNCICISRLRDEKKLWL